MSAYVQYGCGLSAPPTWRNFDASPIVRSRKLPGVAYGLKRFGPPFPANVEYGDIVHGLPVQKNSCRGIYCSHILEHLSLEDFDAALAQTYSYLTPGGVFRCVTPDLEHYARGYLADASPLAAINFLLATNLGTIKRARSVGGFLRAWIGSSAHLSLWDEKALAAKLQEHGFRQIRRAHFGDSEDPRFKDVEEEARFRGAVAMQAIK